MNEFVTFLAESKLADRRWALRVEEGSAFEVISRVVEEMRPDLLIIGTHGRSGIIKVLLGSVTEEACVRSTSIYSPCRPSDDDVWFCLQVRTQSLDRDGDEYGDQELVQHGPGLQRGDRRHRGRRG